MAEIDKDLAEIAEQLADVDPYTCMKCGKCSGRCPAYDEMEYHPHQFVYMIEKGRIEELMNSDSIWNCLSCMACVERCPRNVAPGYLIEAIRIMAIRRQGGNYIKPEDIPCRLDEELPQQAIVSAYRKYSK